MEAKKKAQELVDKFFKAVDNKFVDLVNHQRAKECALICVDELINATRYKCHIESAYNDFETTDYWEQVKQEILNL